YLFGAVQLHPPSTSPKPSHSPLSLRPSSSRKSAGILRQGLYWMKSGSRRSKLPSGGKTDSASRELSSAVVSASSVDLSVGGCGDAVSTGVDASAVSVAPILAEQAD